MISNLVSVVIPTFNRAYCIEDTLQSLIQQTYPHWEAIVVDDGSTDETPQVVGRLSAADSRIRYHAKENGGVAAARNTGLSLANGAFIAFVDSDDLWKPWKLEAQLACLRAAPDAGMIWTDMEAVDAAGKVLAPRYLKILYGAYGRIGTDAIFRKSAFLESIPGLPQSIGQDVLAGLKLYSGNIYEWMFTGNLVHTSTVLLTRDRLEKVKGFDESLKASGEDYDFHLRTCSAGPVAFLDLPSISYRVGGADQLTHSSYYLQIARNALTTISGALARDGAASPLRGRRRRAALASAHGWVGEELFNAGRYAEARQYLMQSARYSPFQARNTALCLASYLPSALIERLLPIYRRLR